MKQITKDKNFQKGFQISHIDSIDHHNDVMLWRFGLLRPDWKICQWCSKFSLMDESHKEKVGNTYKMYNQQKEIIRNEDNSLTLTIKTDKEYEHDRLDGEPWPHLLLEQSFKHVKLKNLTNLIADIDFDFLSFTNHMKEKGELYTFQVTWYFCIANNNKRSKGYKDFFWFGLPFIDTPRLPMGKPYEAVDSGKEDCTSKYIISFDPKEYISKPTEPGDNFKFNKDILPRIKEAFNRAKAKGYLRNCNFEDMELGSTNFGIEDTGTFDGTIRINHINIFED